MIFLSLFKTYNFLTFSEMQLFISEDITHIFDEVPLGLFSFEVMLLFDTMLFEGISISVKGKFIEQSLLRVAQ